MPDRPLAGRITHGGRALEAAYRRGTLPRWARRLRTRWRLQFAVAAGYPSWSSAPAPVQVAIDNGIRAMLLAERLFLPYWRDEEVPPKRYDTASENLRRQMHDLGLTPPQSPVDAAAILAAMRTPDSARRRGPVPSDGGQSEP